MMAVLSSPLFPMKLRSSLWLFVTALAALTPALAQEEPAPLFGRVEGPVYIAPSGTYRIQIPVLGELGGSVEDSLDMVTFRDPYGVHITVAAMPFNATMRLEHETRGRKDFLAWFFATQIHAGFVEMIPGAASESAKYLPSVQDGALLAMNLLPGASAFRDRIAVAPGQAEPVAKRGFLCFVKNEHLFVLSTELSERVIDRATYKKTVEEEDALLRQRLMELLSKMMFTASSKPAATAPAK